MRFSYQLRCCARSLALLSSILGAASLCSAGTVYNVNLTVGTGSVTGTIVTDGTIGALAQADIIGYNLLLSDPAVSAPSTFNLSCCSFFPFSGSDLSATATQLLFNFSGTDSGQVAFADPSLDYDLCFSTSGGAVPSSFCPVAGETLRFLGTSPFGFNFQSTTLSGKDVIATASSVPEPSTLALLCAGIALFGFLIGWRCGLSCDAQRRRQ